MHLVLKSITSRVEKRYAQEHRLCIAILVQTRMSFIVQIVRIVGRSPIGFGLFPYIVKHRMYTSRMKCTFC